MVPDHRQAQWRPRSHRSSNDMLVESATEMLSGEWAIPRIPESRLDYIGVPQENRDAFLSVFGQDIRSLSYSDFATVDYITP
jgi:hypothetical protein